MVYLSKMVIFHGKLLVITRGEIIWRYVWSIHTVDGNNPAPVDRWFIPLLIGFQPSKVVQDFLHPQYVQKKMTPVSQEQIHGLRRAPACSGVSRDRRPLSCIRSITRPNKPVGCSVLGDQHKRGKIEISLKDVKGITKDYSSNM